jgi:HD-GYP domain-containing protein (c-di-GMP phosphodiesterase class II)
VVEAAATHHPYRAALQIDRVLEEITLSRGLRYDPDAVNACLRLFRERHYSLDGQ